MSTPAIFPVPDYFASNYMKSKGNLGTYGDNDAIYRNRAWRVVNEASSMICKEREQGPVSEVLFYPVFELFRSTRQKLAQDLNSQHKELFGVMRNSPENKPDSNEAINARYTTTAVSGSNYHYEPAGDRIKSFVTNKFGKVTAARDAGKAASFGDNDSQVSIKWLGQDHPALKVNTANYKTLPPLLKDLETDDNRETYSMFSTLTKHARSEGGAIVQKNGKLSSIPFNLTHCFFGRENKKLHEELPHFIETTAKLRLNGKLVPVAKSLLYHTDLDDINSPDGLKKSHVIFHHMDPAYIDDGMKECARLFQECVNAPKENVKETLAKFRYVFTHVTPVQRGTCAIGEWLEYALLHSHTGHCGVVDPDVLIELEAMGQPYMPAFVKKYPGFVSCPPLDQVQGKEAADHKVG
jgi:hypothetical protein